MVFQNPFNTEQKTKVFFYELVGTFLFLYASLMTRNAAAISFTLFAATCIFGRHSRGHFNPAVSTCLFITSDNKMEVLSTYFLMITAQILAAVPACVLAQLSLHDPSKTWRDVPIDKVHRLCPQSINNTEWPDKFMCENVDGTEGFHMDIQILVIQIVGTCLLCFVLNYIKGTKIASNDAVMHGLAYSGAFWLLIHCSRK